MDCCKHERLANIGREPRFLFRPLRAVGGNMGLSLKKIAKKITPIVSPITALSGGWGKKEGPKNPYAPPDPSGLTKIDVRNPYMDQIMKSASKPGSFYDYYKPPAETSGGYFDKYIGSINAPSSVQAVQGEIEGQRYEEALRDISRGTDVAMG